jgi:D-alanyl-D-alanine dipeptidase
MSTEEEQEEGVERIYIREAAEQLNRRMATLRKWQQLGVLPQHLTPHRGNRGWRYWTPDQIEGIRGWMRENDRRPGKGLPHYNPSEIQLDRAIAAMRKPRSNARRGGTSAVPEKLVPKSHLKKERDEAEKKKSSGRKKPGS